MGRGGGFGQFDRARKFKPMAGKVARGGQSAEDEAAPVHRLLQQLQIVGRSFVRTGVSRHFTRDERDRGEGRAQFVRGCCSQSVELGQMLRACEHELRRSEGAGGLTRLGRNPVGVESHERRTDRERGSKVRIGRGAAG